MEKKKVMITLCASYMSWPNLVGEGKRDIQEAHADLEDCPLASSFPEDSDMLFFRADLLGSHTLVCHEITLGMDLIISIFSRRLTLRWLFLWA